MSDALGTSIRPNGMRQVKPELARSQILSCSDRNHESLSSSRQCSMDGSRDLQIRTKTHNPQPNLMTSGMDIGDIHKSTYSNEFRGLMRCSTAPANASRPGKDEEREIAKTLNRPSTSCGAERK